MRTRNPDLQDPSRISQDLQDLQDPSRFHNPKLGQHAANVTLRDTRERDRAETESLKLLELPTVAYYRGTVQNPKTCSPRERPYLNYSSFRTLLRGGNA